MTLITLWKRPWETNGGPAPREGSNRSRSGKSNHKRQATTIECYEDVGPTAL